MACKEDEVQYPSFEWVQGPPRQISYQDTVILKFKASPINRYRISLLDGARVIPVQSRPLFSQDDYFEAEVIFTDRYLESDNLDIRIQVYNGGTFNSEISAFNYLGLELEQRGIALLNDMEIEFWDMAGNLDRSYPLSKSFDVLKIDPRDSLIYLVSLADEGVEVRQLGDFQLVNTIPAPLGLNRNSYSTYLKSEFGLYLFDFGGNVQYFESGSVAASGFYGEQGQVNYIRDANLVDGSIAAIKAFGDYSSPEILILNRNLFLEQSRAISGSRIRIAALNEDELALITSDGMGEWDIDKWEIGSSNYGTFKTFNTDSILDFEAINSSEILFSNTYGLYRYDFTPNGGAFPIATGRYRNFQIRKTDGRLFVQKGNLIQSFLLDNNLQFAASTSNTLIDYEILYNK